MKNLILISLILTTLFSCESDMSINDDDYEKYVVVNSIISTDSTWIVKMHYAKPLLRRGDFEPVEDASVHIKVSDNIDNKGEEIQDFFLNYDGNGIYTFENNPKAGRTYKMSIEVDDQELCAETYVPRVLEASIDTSASSSIIDPDNNTITYSIAIEVPDDSVEDNYYAWELKPIVEPTKLNLDEHNGGEEQNNDEVSGTTQEPEQNNPDASTQAPQNAQGSVDSGIKGAVPIFSNGEGKIIASLSAGITDEEVLSSESETANENVAVNGPTTGKKYKLKVWAISLDYYKYLKSIQNNDLSTSESNFVNYYHSNVTNGGGIFAGYNLQEFEIEL